MSSSRDFDDFLRIELAELEATHLLRKLQVLNVSPDSTGMKVRVGRKQLINFASNDYLGMTSSLHSGSAPHMTRPGLQGAGASRCVSGTFDAHQELEKKLAQFKETESCLLFSSGYSAAIGTIPAVVSANDIVLMDRLNHACLIDAVRLSGATVRTYPHLNLSKLQDHLQWAASEKMKAGSRTWIITETVFSMDGDVAPLKELVALKNKFGSCLLIDEAHATGIYGKNGAGIASMEGVQDQIEVTMGTLSKSLGGLGGYVAGSQKLIEFLINKARTFIFSTALPPVLVESMLHSLRRLTSREGKASRTRLWDNIAFFQKNMDIAMPSHDNRSPIFPLVLGSSQAALKASDDLFQRGFLVPAIRYPTVPRNEARLRISLSATHERESILKLAKCINESWSDWTKS